MERRIFELTRQDGKTLQERSLKLCEEAGELAQAVLSATGAPGSSYKKLGLEDVREEAADAAIVALSILAQTCDDEEAFLAHLEGLFAAKCGKWKEMLSRSS
jgi:NTP pyrophosphatase (non-canonical NTP hydrolase)